jgi:hypothetical protein
MRRRVVLSLLLLLAGCATRPAIEDQTRLASACQVTKCRCAGERTSIFREAPTAPLKWRRDGSAYCEEGLHLERVTDEQRTGY